MALKIKTGKLCFELYMQNSGCISGIIMAVSMVLGMDCIGFTDKDNYDELMKK